MNISTHEFNPELTELHGRVFPDEIEADPFVVFHGTSGFNAASIEATGFYFPSSALSREKFERVSRIYEMIKWSGLHRGGYAVLKPFSMNHDFGEGAQSPIFFGDSSHQSLLYASRDFAGGEKLRALRISIGDLDEYVAHSKIRKEHQTSMINHFAQLTKLNAHTSMLEAARPLQVDLIWLTKQLDELEAIRQMADAAHRQFQHGVIYAIKVRPEYWKSLREISFMGIEATMPIPASTIISKIVIPASYVWKVGRHNNVVEKSSLRKQMLNALENKLKSEIRAI